MQLRVFNFSLGTVPLVSCLFQGMDWYVSFALWCVLPGVLLLMAATANLSINARAHTLLEQLTARRCAPPLTNAVSLLQQ